jgi:hypothetical protein
MDTASAQILLVLEYLVKPIPIGTNLALLQLMWVMINGSFLASRGAVHSALRQLGLDDRSIARGWRALRRGVWSIEELLLRWQKWVARETEWAVKRHEGWEPVAIDITTFWRPKLKKWPLRGFHQLAGRLLPGVVIGVIVRVGQVKQQRVPLLHKVYRSPTEATDEEPLQKRLLTYAGKHLAESEVAIVDGGFKLKALQEAGVPRFVVRLATNCVLRRNHLPERQSNRGRRREYGVVVRPLSRRYKGKIIGATQPDETVSFLHNSVRVTARGWHGLVRSDQKVGSSQQTLTVWVFADPRYKTALVVATNLPLSAQSAFNLYLDRWPVEQVPLAAKQMLGLHRMFVHASASIWRLPELAMLMGNVLTVIAAILPPMPSGYWDRRPKKRVVGYDAPYSALLFLN